MELSHLQCIGISPDVNTCSDLRVDALDSTLEMPESHPSLLQWISLCFSLPSPLSSFGDDTQFYFGKILLPTGVFSIKSWCNYQSRAVTPPAHVLASVFISLGVESHLKLIHTILVGCPQEKAHSSFCLDHQLFLVSDPIIQLTSQFYKLLSHIFICHPLSHTHLRTSFSFLY